MHGPRRLVTLQRQHNQLRQPEHGRAWIRSTSWKKCNTPSQHCSTLRPSCARQCAQHWCRQRPTRSASGARGSAIAASRAWKLFLLTPRMLLARTPQQGSQGRAELLSRAAKFQRGEWPQLLRSARQAAQQPTSRNEPQQDGAGERKRRRVCAKVRQAEVSRARQVLTAAEIAPGTQATLRALTDPARRPPELRREIPEEVLQHQPQQPTRLATGAVASALRETHRGGAAGLSGMRTEHLKLLLQDVEAMELLAEAASQLASAEVSPDIARGISAARLTALSKPDGGVRGIATGDGLRRLVSRTLAKGWAAIFDQATRPYQYSTPCRRALVLGRPRQGHSGHAPRSSPQTPGRIQKLDPLYKPIITPI